MSGFQRINQPIILGRSAAAVALTGTLAQTDLASIVVPAGAMGLNGQLRITAQWSCTNNANTKVAYQLMGGATLSTVNLAANDGMEIQRRIVNQNNAAVQVGFTASSVATFGAGAKSAYAINTANAQTLTLTGLLTNVADTLTLESYLVELFPW